MGSLRFIDIIKFLRLSAGISEALEHLFVEQIICEANPSWTNIYRMPDVLCSLPGVQDVPKARQMGAFPPGA